MGFGSTPSLSRLLARNGPAGASIMAVERVPPHTHGGQPQRKWVLMLGVTCNQRLPFGGMDTLTWENIINRDLPHARGIHKLINHLVWSGNENFCREEGLTLACSIIQHTEPKAFDRFFTVLRRVLKRKWALPLLRRIVITVPTYDTHIIASCRHAIKNMIHTLPIPKTLQDWYTIVLTIISEPSPPITRAVDSGTRTTVPALVVGVLRGTVGGEVTKTCTHSGVPCSRLNYQSDLSEDFQHAYDLTKQWVSNRPCTRTLTRASHPSLRNCLGHMVLRHMDEWSEVLPRRSCLLVMSNARNRALYSEEEFGLAFDLARDNLKEVSIPLPDFGEGRQPLPIFDARGPNNLLLPPLKARMWEQAAKRRSEGSFTTEDLTDTK